jgi:hypothetical protein
MAAESRNPKADSSLRSRMTAISKNVILSEANDLLFFATREAQT